VRVTLKDLAALVRGTVHGDADVVVEAARPIGEAESGSITFLENDRLARSLNDCRAAAVVMPAALAARRDELLPSNGHAMSVLEVADALTAFVAIVRHLHPPAPAVPPSIDPLASVHPSARLSADCTVGPFVTVGAGSVIGARCHLHDRVTVGRNCRLGDDVELYPGVVLYDGTLLGNRVTVHANAVIGADGFGYRVQDGKHAKVPQFGYVDVGDDVEIGAGTAIDRGTFGATRIGVGTKIDNLVQIGHNCSLGRHNLIVSQVGIAGSCSTGDYVVIAGQVGIADHVHIGNGALVGARSGIHRDIGAGERILGAPGRPESEEKRILLSLEKLPELRRDVRHLKQHLGLAQ
jgi:UDP-3-O-[3-hydroxymyristoyl] glucosamine N-acyltransferase